MQSRHVVVATSKQDKQGYRLKDETIFEAFEGDTHGGTLVVADTHQQVLNKACKAIKRYEVDAMFRTKDGHQKFEQALAQLRNLGPCMVRERCTLLKVQTRCRGSKSSLYLAE
jgi:hypothetical protein